NRISVGIVTFEPFFSNRTGLVCCTDPPKPQDSGMTYLVIKYDLRAPAFGASAPALYRAAVEQCSWADRHGFGTVMLAEQHGSDDGYLPSPVALGCAIAAVTEQIRIRVQALIAPFHDPLRLAEDLAVLDLLSAGRAEITAAGGYVPQ